jgi:TatD DNase family protein
MYIDSHCHLIHKRLLHLGGPDQVIKNAAEAEVEAMLTICCDIHEEFPQVLALAKEYSNVWCSVGTHPHDAGVEEEKQITLEKLISLANSDDNVIGIGETGLDYFYKNSSIEDQQESFRKHIRACLETDLPLIIHSRDAEEDLMRIVKEEASGSNLKGVMHCFSSSRAHGEEALEFGFYISFSGILTFKKSEELRDFAKIVPIEKALIETLAPEPHRGKINEPALVVHTAKMLAEINNLDEKTVANASKENFFSLFSKAKLS